MKKLVFMLTVLLFATSTFAVAADQKVGTKVPVQMTDAEMVQVVGGVQAQSLTGSWGYLHYVAEQAYANLLHTLPLTNDQRHLIDSKLSSFHSLIGGKTRIGLR